MWFWGVQWVWHNVCGVVSSMCVVCVHVVGPSGGCDVCGVVCVMWAGVLGGVVWGGCGGRAGMCGGM